MIDQNKISVEILAKNVIDGTEDKYKFSTDSLSIPLKEILHYGIGVSFNSYYSVYHGMMGNQDLLPYILRDGKYVFDVPIDTVTLGEFLQTHPQCNNEGIVFEYGYPQASGLSFLAVKVAWPVVIAILKKKAGHDNLVDCLNDIMSNCMGEFEKKGVRPLPMMDLILQYSEVGSIQISEELGIEKYQAELLLNELGYKYNSHTGKYGLSRANRDKAFNLLTILENKETAYRAEYEGIDPEIALQDLKSKEIKVKADNITYLVMDVDGTLTDGKIYMSPTGEAMKAFNIKDGCGIHDILIPHHIVPVIVAAIMN